jgi:hypothetical protein
MLATQITELPARVERRLWHLEYGRDIDLSKRAHQTWLAEHPEAYDQRDYKHWCQNRLYMARYDVILPAKKYEKLLDAVSLQAWTLCSLAEVEIGELDPLPANTRLIQLPEEQIGLAVLHFIKDAIASGDEWMIEDAEHLLRWWEREDNKWIVLGRLARLRGEQW